MECGSKGVVSGGVVAAVKRGLQKLRFVREDGVGSKQGRRVWMCPRSRSIRKGRTTSTTTSTTITTAMKAVA